MSGMMQRILEEEGVWEKSTRVGELDFGLVPLEDDFLSMEMPNIYREVPLSLPSAARLLYPQPPP